MPVRDWDKARRYDRARAPYDPIASFNPRRRRNKRFKRLASFKAASTPKTSCYKPVCRKFLQAIGGSLIVYSEWVRNNGHWRCVFAQEPLSWFTRLNNPIKAKEFLLSNHFQFNWLNAMPSADRSKQALAERPADSYTANAPSLAPANNTSPALNNDTQADLTPRVKEVVKFPAASSSCTGAEWLHHSSPLNALARASTSDSCASPV